MNRQEDTCSMCGEGFIRGTLAAHVPVCLGTDPSVEDFYRVGRVEPVLRVERLGVCLEWQRGLTSTGYAMLPKRARQRLRTAYVSRAILMATSGLPAGTQALHHCDNRLCVRVEHLYAGTPGDNVADMFARGQRVRQPNKVCPVCGTEFYKRTKQVCCSRSCAMRWRYRH